MRLVVDRQEGTQLPGPFEVCVKVRAEDTGGAMAVLEQTVPPHRLITPHVHNNDVWVYVLSGTIGVLVGDEIVKVGPGSWALKPRSVVHAMWNAETDPARIIEVLTPGGSERWFEEVAELAEDDDKRFHDACERHGIRFVTDSAWTSELRARYGL